MREAIPTELLWRLMNATAEQFAAVARVLGMGTNAEGGIRNAEWGAPHPSCGHLLPSAEKECEEVARSAFALLQKLELDAPLKAPSVLTVFRLYCVDGHSAERVARKCRCAKGTVMRRLRFIEARTGVKAAAFRAMSGHLQQMDDDLRESGAREIYRRGLAQDED